MSKFSYMSALKIDDSISLSILYTRLFVLTDFRRFHTQRCKFKELFEWKFSIKKKIFKWLINEEEQYVTWKEETR